MPRARLSGLTFDLNLNVNLTIGVERTPPQTPTKPRHTSASYPASQDEPELKTSKAEGKTSHNQAPIRSPDIRAPLTPPSSSDRSSPTLSSYRREPVSPLAKRSLRKRSGDNQVEDWREHPSGSGLKGAESEHVKHDEESLAQASTHSQLGSPDDLDLPAPQAIPRPALPSLKIDRLPKSRSRITSCPPPQEIDSIIESDSMPRLPGAYPASPIKRALTELTGPCVADIPPADTESVTTDPTKATQCCGLTKNGVGPRCKRPVKPNLALLHQAPGAQVERFCHDHIGPVLRPKGYYPHGSPNTWVSFAEWVPSHLKEDTQAALRIEMERYVSDSDEAGYIYAYEIRNPNTPNEFHIKIGRSVNPGKRLDDWSKQCTSSEPVLRGWWPGNIEDSSSADLLGLLTGRVGPGKMGKYCHRLERLIHLELSDVALNSTHLTSRFKAGILSQEGNASVSSRSRKASSPPKRVKKPCPDCGKKHQEIFTLKRVASGEMAGQEWEKIVMPIIERWGRFVSEYASKGP